MKEFWWKLPLLRRMSAFQRGLIEPVAGAAVVAAVMAVTGHRYTSDPSADLCSSLAQIGATLLIAYAVQMSWVLENSRKRGATRENWVGFTCGIGLCSVVGIGLALILSDHGGPLGWLADYGFSWSIVSLAFLGGWIAFQPWAMYDWTHWFSTEYPDE